MEEINGTSCFVTMQYPYWYSYNQTACSYAKDIYVLCRLTYATLTLFSEEMCRVSLTCEGYCIFQSTLYVTTMEQQNFCTCCFTFLNTLNIEIIYYNSKEMFASFLLAYSSHFAHKHILICMYVCVYA